MNITRAAIIETLVNGLKVNSVAEIGLKSQAARIFFNEIVAELVDN